jgi:hypothetical protein
MQITVNNDFATGGPFTQAQIASFLQDERTAVNILDATFTNNISLTFNVGFASIEGKKWPQRRAVWGMPTSTRRFSCRIRN